MRVRPMVKRIAAIAAGGGMLVVMMSQEAAAAPVASKKVVVTRNATDPHKIEISWLPAPGVHHYNVSVFDGATDDVTVVPASSTTSSLVRPESCLRLRVNVGSRDTRGAGGTSSNMWLDTLAPGGISGLRADRQSDGTRIDAAWKVPTWLGWGAPGDYKVQLIRSGDNVLVFDGVSTEASKTFTGLNPANDYTLKVSAQNAFGLCSTGSVAVGSKLPGAVTGVKAVRDAATPALVKVSWPVPSYTGYGKITSYLVGSGQGKITEWAKVDGTSTALKLDDHQDWVVQVQAVSDIGNGRLGALTRVSKVGAPGAAAVQPGITLSQSGKQITVRSSGKIGAYAEYPKLVVRVRSTVDGGFSTEQWGQTGATALVLNDIAAGTYVVQVSGVNDTGEQEWARQIMNVGDVGVVPASAWRLVAGRSTPTGDSVAIEKKNETRLLSALTRTGTDATLISNVTLREGRGYAVSVRTSVENATAVGTDNDTGKKLSGYVIEYDPGYSTAVANYGPAMVLRLQYKGTACSTPMALTKMPASVAAAGAHRVAIVVKGDSLYANVDDTVVFDVASLSALAASSPCRVPLPNGNQVGVWNWSDGGSAVTFSHTTVN